MPKTLQTKLPDDLAERFTAAAEKEGLTVSKWLRLAGEQRLGITSSVTPTAALVLDSDLAIRTSSESLTVTNAEPGSIDEQLPSTVCFHPKEALRRFSWGTVCGVCDERIR